MERAAAIVAAVCAGATPPSPRREEGTARGGSRWCRRMSKPGAGETPRPVRIALERAIESLTAFHRVQIPADVSRGDHAGGIGGTALVAAAAVAAYVPGGLAAYPSTLLMTVCPLGWPVSMRSS